MWLKAQNEMAGLWPHAAMGPVERMVSDPIGALPPQIVPKVNRSHGTPLTNQLLSAIDLRGITCARAELDELQSHAWQ